MSIYTFTLTYHHSGGDVIDSAGPKFPTLESAEWGANHRMKRVSQRLRLLGSHHADLFECIDHGRVFIKRINDLEVAPPSQNPSDELDPMRDAYKFM